jgi:hypothetical protein
VADLKTQWKMKGKEELHSFCQNTKRDRGESYFERYYRNGSSPWFREIKMNCLAFMSTNRMRAGHTSLTFLYLFKIDMLEKGKKEMYRMITVYSRI